MKIAIVAILACLFVVDMAPSMESGDWLSNGYVVTHHHAAPVIGSWGHGISYPIYYDSTVFDPWYRNVAWPFLNNWYWPPSYYRSGSAGYPFCYYPGSYWYGPVLKFP